MYDPSGLYVDPILTNFSVGWQDENMYALRLAPETPVDTKSGRYRVFDRSSWLIYRSRREPGTQANTIQGRKWSEDTFATKEHSLQAEIYDEERRQLQSQGGLANAVFGGALQIDPERDAADDVTRSLMLEAELKVSTIFRDTTQYPANHVATLTGGATGTRWDNYALLTAGDPTTAYSDPVANLKAAWQRVYLDTGRWPNTVIIPFDALGVVENHPRVVRRFLNFALTIPEAWQQLMGLPPGATDNLNIFVVDSKFNTADNIDLAENIVSFWGQDIWVGLVDQTPGQRTFTFAKTFSQSYTEAGGQVRPTENWREENRKTDLVRTSWSYDIKVVSGVAGYLIKTAVNAVV
jgi:hypothetical protein